jgi:hypothetical protein
MSAKYEFPSILNLSPLVHFSAFEPQSQTCYSDMAGIMRRMRGKEVDLLDAISESPQISSSGSTEPADNIEKDGGRSTALDVEEANRKLKTFERAHRWDPNLDDDQLEEIDDAVNAHDPRAEGKLISEVLENSPYPEVRLKPLNNHFTSNYRMSVDYK